ncbi:hypothetical protein BN12_1940001 [Nostocoides japonicum T1-X7]|uniref:DUF2470 domain-containing protein n=1 Tax=Nostocoides japonicum T1-X7 TaxID=1194083 RepID=A0A077LZM2_9MICO|nr:hypothetical protein [Tetrasphaera japonica]CCH77420.1 hypothetical protein BN12_1940001 [Tetrasphaera japonica T1-X7]
MKSAKVRTEDVAAEARSILSCPAQIGVTIDGVLARFIDGAHIAAREDGRPTFACHPDDPLVDAARCGSAAVLTVRSGVTGGWSEEATVIVTGRLLPSGRFECDCCDAVREQVDVDPATVVLCVPDGDGRQTRIQVPLDAFHDPAHGLNRGYLQQSTTHLNMCHQRELRLAVGALAQLHLADIAGVTLSDLHPDGVVIGWVTLDGAHRRELRFSRAARTVTELGELLRFHLHHGLC